MNKKLLLSYLACVILTSVASPAFSNSALALSVSIDKEGVPQGQAVNTPNSDLFLTDQVKQAFKDDKNLSKEITTVQFETKDGVVTLTGTVSDETAKADISQKVLNVPGVKGVNNKLDVK